MTVDEQKIMTRRSYNVTNSSTNQNDLFSYHKINTCLRKKTKSNF